MSGALPVLASCVRIWILKRGPHSVAEERRLGPQQGNKSESCEEGASHKAAIGMLAFGHRQDRQGHEKAAGQCVQDQREEKLS